MKRMRPTYKYEQALRVAALALSAVCSESVLAQEVDASKAGGYAATIRRTSYGIPHITARDIPSAAYGQGYAMAEDHICTLADQFIKLRSERAKHFGRGDFDINIESDFGYHAYDIRARAKEMAAQQDAKTRAIARGFVAGYNRYLQKNGSKLPAPCTGAAWVKPIDEEDLFAHLVDLALLGPARALLTAVGGAQPPGSTDVVAPAAEELPNLRTRLASNGWAFGSAHSQSGRGALLSNPHFPWGGELRFHEVHLTVPGTMDVYGISLLGVPSVMIGFNDKLAWTLTFSASQQAAIYTLELDPADPTRYRIDGTWRAMTKRKVKVKVDGADPISRTVYSTKDHGPLISLPGFGWDAQFATAIAPASIDSYNTLRQFIRMDTATDLRSFKNALAEERGLPWVNVMYTDREGNAYYADASRVPDLSKDVLAELTERLSTDFTTQLLWQTGLVLLDGSTSKTSFRDGNGRSKIIPFKRAPQLTRTDFVQNANNAYPFTNPAASFGEHSLLYIGTQAVPRPRTRLALQLLTDRGSSAPSGADLKWTRQEITAAALRGDAMIANQLRDAVVARCQAAGTIQVDEHSVALGPACSALAGWDKRVNLESTGAAMWREFLSEFDEASIIDQGPLFAIGADPSDPIGTPRDLTPAPAGGQDPILIALGRALLRLQGAGIDPAVRLDGVQFLWNGDTIPVPGSVDLEGSLNAAEVNPSWLDSTVDMVTLPPVPPIPRRPEQLQTGLTEQGYFYTYGASFMMALEFTAEGPRADAVLIYGESSNPASPHYFDQIDLYLNKQWRPIQFRDADITADPGLTSSQVDGS
jgi:acyl-homoserine-lactone acylase